MDAYEMARAAGCFGVADEVARLTAALAGTVAQVEEQRLRAQRAEAEVERLKLKEQGWVDAVCHYRNLAISLGAKPADMLTDYDRSLAERGVGDADGWKNEAPDCWDRAERAERERDEARRTSQFHKDNHLAAEAEVEWLAGGCLPECRPGVHLMDCPKAYLARAQQAEAALAAEREQYREHLAAHRTADAHDCAEMEECFAWERERAERLRSILDDALAVLQAPAMSSHKAKRELAAKMRAALRAWPPDPQADGKPGVNVRHSDDTAQARYYLRRRDEPQP